MTLSNSIKSNINISRNYIFNGNYSTQNIEKLITKFYSNLSDIILDKEKFLEDLICFLDVNVLNENQIRNYLEFILKVMRLTEENILEINDKILQTNEYIKIVKIKYIYLDNSAVIEFTNKRRIVFINENLEDDRIFGVITCWFNSKLSEETSLYERKIISNKNYAFTEYIEELECKKEEFCKYYFSSGQLLALLYMLGINTLTKKNIVQVGAKLTLKDLLLRPELQKEIIRQDFSASKIAEDILSKSAYNIKLLLERKKILAQNYLTSIKLGFENLYSLIVDNKLELVNLINKIFNNNPLYLGSIIPRIYGMNDSGLKQQLYFLDVHFSKSQLQEANIKFSYNTNPSKIKKEYIMNLAVSLGDHIIQKSIIGVSGSNTNRAWISTIDSGEKLSVISKCDNIYYGNSGVALFLLYLGVVTKKDYFIKTAVEAVRESITYIESLDYDKLLKVENFRNVNEQIYTLTMVHSVTKDQYIKDVIIKAISLIASFIDKQTVDNSLKEIIDFMVVLMNIYQDDCLEDRELVSDLINLMYKKIQNVLSGLKSFSDVGFNVHGLINVLARVYQLTNDKQAQLLISKLLDSERSIDDNTYHEDLKYDYNNRRILSRIILKEINFNDDIIDIEIRKLLEDIIENFGRKPYLYHGDIGTLEIIDYAAGVLKDKSLKNRCDNTFNELVNKAIAVCIRDELSKENKSISFMRGVSGQGYSLIRMCSPNLIPRMLWIYQ